MAGEDSGCGESTASRGGGETIEAGEHVGEKWMAGFALNKVLISGDVAAAEGCFSSGDSNGVKHSIAVEEMVWAAREELRVGAISNVGAV